MKHRFVPMPFASLAPVALVLGLSGAAPSAAFSAERDANLDVTATVHAVKADTGELDVVSGVGHALRVYALRVGPECEIRVDGESATLPDLEAGQIVRVHYRDTDGGKEALAIEASPAGEGRP